ncbi:MAG: prepilin-type N-terminal cleavage/methylation domain-containing protein [bacterium]
MNNKGFTLIELIITMIVIAIIAAASISIYNGIVSGADTAAIINNIGKLKADTEQYASLNGGSYSNLSAASMQADGLIPNNWAINGNWSAPPNVNLVTGYWIGQGAWGIRGTFDIGFGNNNNDITNSIARQICADFENKIAGFGYNGNAYAISSGGTNCNIIPANSQPLSGGSFYLGFE